MTKNIKQLIIILLLTAVAVGWRVINHQYTIAPNLELVTSMTVLAAVMIGFRAAIIVPISSMIVSDLIIGNMPIFVYTWSAFALIGLMATILCRFNDRLTTQILSSVGFAAASSFVFFVVTNFGVWAQGWYPATIDGLIRCYTLAIPFYRTMLIGNLILVPVVVGAWQLYRAYQASNESVVDALVSK